MNEYYNTLKKLNKKLEISTSKFNNIKKQVDADTLELSNHIKNHLSKLILEYGEQDSTETFIIKIKNNFHKNEYGIFITIPHYFYDTCNYAIESISMDFINGIFITGKYVHYNGAFENSSKKSIDIFNIKDIQYITKSLETLLESQNCYNEKI